MRNLKAIAFLMVLIAALLTLDLTMERWNHVVKTGVRTTLIDSDERVSGIRIERRDAPPIALERTGTWRIAEPFSGTADEQAVSRLTDALLFTPILDVITDSRLLKLGRTRADFSLANPILKVSVSGAESTTCLSFGLPTPTGDGVYVAVEGTDAVFVLPTGVFAAVDQKADAFRWRPVLPMGKESVVSFAIRNGTGQPVLFARTDEGWTIGEARASKSKISEFLSGLLSATAVDFLWPIGATNKTALASSALLVGYGLDPENAVTVTLKGGDGQDRHVSFGKAAGERLVYAMIQNDSAIVTVPAALRDAAMAGSVSFADVRAFPLEASAVSVFSIADGDATYAFSRDGANGWRLESPIVAPADAKVVDALLGRLLALPSSACSKEGLQVTISTNREPLVIARDRVLGSVKFEDLRSREMIAVDSETVRRLVRTGGEKGAKPTSVAYDRDRRAWNVESAEEGMKVREKGVRLVLDALSPLVAVRVEKIRASAADLDDYGLDRPFLTLAVDQDRKGAVRRNLLIGGSAGKDGRYATIGSADAIFVISEKSVDRLSQAIVEK